MRQRGEKSALKEIGMHSSDAVVAKPNAVLRVKRGRLLPGGISGDTIAMRRDNNPISPAIRTRSDPFLIDPRGSGVANPRIGMETSKMTCKGRACDLGEWFDIRQRFLNGRPEDLSAIRTLGFRGEAI